MSATDRPETGVMKFGDDWPGVFFRGDDAFLFSMAIEAGVREVKAPITKSIMLSLLKTLRACVVKVGKMPMHQAAMIVSAEDSSKIGAFNLMLTSNNPIVKRLAERYLAGAENLDDFTTYLKTAPIPEVDESKGGACVDHVG